MPKPGERQQMRSADPAQPGDGDALATQGLLFGPGHPADVARKGLVVIELGSRHRM